MRASAWVSFVFWLCACGGDATRDAGLRDVAVDVPFGLVNVTVDLGQGPVAGAHVLFTDPAGAKITLVDTDAQGRASAQVPLHSAVTAAAMSGTGYVLITVLDIAPGDDLLLGSRSASTPTLYGNATFTVPDRAGTTTGYQISDGCTIAYPGEPPAAQTLPVDTRCADAQGKFAAIGVAKDATGLTLGFTTLTTLQMNADAGVFTGSFTFPPWQNPTASTTINLQNQPPTGWTGIFVDVDFQRNGVSYYDDSKSLTTTTFQSQIQFPAATGFFTSQLDTVSISFPLVSNVRSGLSHVERDPDGANALIDFRTFLPKIHDPTVTIANGVPTLTFMADGAIEAADGQFARIVWRELPDGGTSGPSHSWIIVSRPMTTVVPPALPSELAAWTFQMDNATFPGATGSAPFALIATSTAVAGYDAFRQNASHNASVVATELPSGNFSMYTTSFIGSLR